VRFMIFVGFLFTTLATASWAQDIRWKPETLKVGDYISIRQSQNGVVHHVYRGKTGRRYILDSYYGAQPSGKPAFTTYLDRNGNYLKWVRQDGFSITYKPHDCTRTLGRCQYTSISSDGKREVRLRITKATGNGFQFDEYTADGKRHFGGKMKIDARGFAGNGRITGYDGSQSYCQKGLLQSTRSHKRHRAAHSPLAPFPIPPYSATSNRASGLSGMPRRAFTL